jgi:2-polyprenyl-3-methyl-5-hydroxy-6-metoxy-1,4-benzoquinol methylase
MMQGWETHGCELSPADFEIARAKHGDRILHLNFEEFPLAHGPFDAVTLQDVFDHLPDPMGALAKCRALLRPGGLLVIKVHDISCLYARFTGANFYAIMPPSHLFYYNRSSLTTMLEKAGFRVTASRHIGHLLKLKTVFFRLSRGDRKSPYYRVFDRLNRSPIGDWKIYKNLHDIITVFAVK